MDVCESLILTTMRRILPRLAMIVLPLVAGGCGGVDVNELRLLGPALVNAPHQIGIDAGVIYDEHDGKPLRADVYRPRDTAERLPLVLLVHGGSWRSGRRTDMEEYAYDIACAGHVAATIDYRLVNKTIVFPAPVADVLAALRFFRQHADDFGIDPARVCLLGLSAGGNLALLPGLAKDVSVFDPSLPAGQSAGIACIVNLFGPTDFTIDPATATDEQINLVEGYLGGSLSDIPFNTRVAASPISYARADGPPVLIVHGTADPLVPVAQARTLHAVLDAAGEENIYVEIPGMGHIEAGFWYSPWAQLYRPIVFDFLASHL